ncbi:MAG TPA: TlpA disulfide reductase family protein [Bryobacteraceae bacterium]|jgi:thiol-disulfide isomerase/thioredoxin|nr:TlpA disulfide reductase family protein [Bryobacteraceae bacterium]
MRYAAAVFVFTLCLHAQSVVSLDPAGDIREQTELNQAVADAGGSSIDLIRLLEQHLGKYPASKQRAVIEKTIVKAAMETNDNARIIRYGQAVVNSEIPPDSNDTMIILDRVIRALVNNGDAEQAKQALSLANRYESDVAALRAKMAPPPGHLTPGQWSEELDKAMARALALKARATGDAGGREAANAAEELARKSWESYPTGEGAQETAFWLAKLGRNADAVEFYADAFTLEDSGTTAADRARIRNRLGEIYSKLNGSEKGLGDAILQAYDRTSAILGARRANLQAQDPNSTATEITSFTLPAVDKSAKPLMLSSLKGKTVVMDFWATWCAPCRAQQPLIEKVREHYRDMSDVVFVPVDADDDPSLAAPFVKQQGWSPGYLEAGLARQLTISQIPTVLVLGPDQKISSRMIGFVPDRFEQMLEERIEEARRK